ncbi:DnaJ-like protein subfamily A member 3, mitochondrial, partial [Stegodyphus mimosarum]
MWLNMNQSLSYTCSRLQNKLFLNALLRCFNKSHPRTYSRLLSLTSRERHLLEGTSTDYFPSCWHTRIFHQSHSNCARADLYKLLGVSRNASQNEIKKAYYQLAKKYHPDTNKNDPEAAKKFQEVSAAYEILGDEAKRREYDQWGKKQE